jgi:chemotaxis protein MotB
MIRRAVVLLTLAATVAACHPTKEEYAAKEVEATGYKKQLDDESQRGADLEKSLGETRTRVAGLEEEKRTLQAQVKAGEDNLGTKQQDLRAAQDRIAQLQAMIDELSKSKKKLEQAKEELEKKSAAYQQLADSLKGEIDSGKIELSELRGKMTVKMKDKILFASGSATLGKEGKEALKKVAEAFMGVKGKMIRVEGHTDSDATGKDSPFSSNWELSSARAIAVVRFLQEQGLDPTLLAAAGYSQYQPVAANTSPEGKSQNRRIEIVLAPAEVGPAAAPAAK